MKILKTQNLSSKRDFLDIEDVCRGLWAVGLKGKRGEVYNICSQKEVVIRDVLLRLIQVSNVKNIIVEEDKQAFVQSFNVIGSNAKLKALSWKPRVSLKQSLTNTLKSYENTYRA